MKCCEIEVIGEPLRKLPSLYKNELYIAKQNRFISVVMMSPTVLLPDKYIEIFQRLNYRQVYSLVVLILKFVWVHYFYFLNLKQLGILTVFILFNIDRDHGL